MTPIYCVGLHKINITVGYLLYLDETVAVSLLCLVESISTRRLSVQVKASMDPLPSSDRKDLMVPTAALLLRLKLSGSPLRFPICVPELISSKYI